MSVDVDIVAGRKFLFRLIGHYLACQPGGNRTPGYRRDSTEIAPRDGWSTISKFHREVSWTLGEFHHLTVITYSITSAMLCLSTRFSMPSGMSDMPVLCNSST